MSDTAALPLPGRPARITAWLDDRISPMIIKELRQGVKSKAFGFAFMLMQGLMVFCVLLYAIAFSNESDQMAFNVMFWIFLGASLLIITPLRALNSLQTEIKGNTLELIFLSRLTAWRIVSGKWLALYAQNLLIASASMPYLLLRYFLGGFDVVFDLTMLFWVLLGSAVLTAVAVCLSAFKAQFVRAIVGVLAVVAPYIVAVSIFSMSMGGRHLFAGSSFGAGEVLGLVFIIVVGVIFALNWGAGRIAPPAENYALRKRIWGTALVAILLGAALLLDEKGYVVIAALLITALGLDTILERPRFIPSLYTGFARRGTAGRLGALFLLPGWPSGVLFLILHYVALAAVASRVDLLDDIETQNVFIALPGALLFPLGVVLLIRAEPKHLGASYFGIQLLCFLTGVAGMTVRSVYSSANLEGLSILPPTALMLSVVEIGDTRAWGIASGIASLLAVVILIVRMRPHLARQHELLRQGGETEPASPTPEAPAA